MFFRLIVMFVLISIIPLFGMREILLISTKDKLYSERVENISVHCKNLADQVETMSFLSGENKEIILNQMEQLSNIYDGRIVIIDADYTVKADSYFRLIGKIVISEDAMTCMNTGEEIWHHNKSFDMIEMAIPIKAEDGTITGVMLISSSTATKTAAYQYISKVSSLVFISLAILVLIMIFLFSRELTKPFKTLVKSINHISEGHFDETVHLKGYKETELISSAFNKMLGKLKNLEESRQEFVSNVSHELKTPITSMKVLAESLNMQPDAPKELYQEFMEDIVKEIDRENQIITDLLSLVKMDKKSGDLNIAEVNVNELIELIFKRLKPIASKKNIELAFDGYKLIKANVDEVKMTLAFSNLIENAIKYNVAGGWVKVSLDADQEYFYLQVADSGIGIPAEFQNRIFERFYRVDKARSRETGGTGLGLAITKNIILMHNGNIKVKSKEDEGTTFTVRVPLVYVNEIEE